MTRLVCLTAFHLKLIWSSVASTLVVIKNKICTSVNVMQIRYNMGGFKQNFALVIIFDKLVEDRVTYE